MNEPVEVKPAPPELDYHATQTRAAKAIRAIDPEMPIIVEALELDSPRGFAEMTLVEAPNVIYQVHMYEPGEFTHQGVYNKAAGIAYPGMINKKMYDADVLRAILTPVREFQLAYNAHIYVGEFSAIRREHRNIFPMSSIFLNHTAGTGRTTLSGNGRDGAWNMPTSRWIKVSINPAATARKEVLLAWFARNRKPVYPDAAKWMKDDPPSQAGNALNKSNAGSK